MRSLLTFIIGLAVVGCQRSETDPQPTPAKSERPERVDATQPTPKAVDLKSLLKKKINRERLRAAQRPLRERDYARQKPGPTPPALPKVLTRLIPQGIDLKVIGFEIHQEMKLVRPAPGRLFLRLRMLTLNDGAKLREALRKTYQDAGWLKPSQPLRSPVQHPKRGLLTWNILEPNERPSTVDISIESTVGVHSVPTLDTLIRETPSWWKMIPSSSRTIFEYSWFHGVHFGRVFSDIERVSVHVRTSDDARRDEGIYAAASAARYVPDDDNPRLMRGPARSTLFVRKLDASAGLVAHHHRRWGTGVSRKSKTP